MTQAGQIATPEQLNTIGAKAAELIGNGQAVGLGSGKASHAFVRMLGKRVREQGLKMIGIPTSESTARLAREVGIPLGSLEDIRHLDIAVDGADEVDPKLNLTKGGGGDLLREKVIASIARRCGAATCKPRTRNFGLGFPQPNGASASSSENA